MWHDCVDGFTCMALHRNPWAQRGSRPIAGASRPIRAPPTTAIDWWLIVMVAGGYGGNQQDAARQTKTGLHRT